MFPISGIIFGIICAIVADSRGRSAIAWFFIGFFLPCIGLVILLVSPDLQVMERRDNDLSLENRRLREKIRRDRILADSRHTETLRRIDLHDSILQVDTSTPPSLEGHLDTAQILDQSGEECDKEACEFAENTWWYADPNEAQQVGPVTFDALRQLWKNKTIGAQTLVWCEMFGDWEKINDVWDLEERLNA